MSAAILPGKSYRCVALNKEFINFEILRQVCCDSQYFVDILSVRRVLATAIFSRPLARPCLFKNGLQGDDGKISVTRRQSFIKFKDRLITFVDLWFDANDLGTIVIVTVMYLIL